MIQIIFKPITIDKTAWFQASLLLIGILSFTYGSYLVWKPLGFMIGGIFVFGVGVLMNKISEKK